MAGDAADVAGRAFERKVTLRAVTVIMAAVVGLTFLFGFGNVWTLALRLGVPPWVAPLVAPAVDLSVMGLLLGTRYLALHGARPEDLRPARRLLVFSSVMTLALNVTDPLIAHETGKAAFDAVGPLLLIGWAEVGPGLLQAISRVEGAGPVGDAMSEAGRLDRTEAAASPVQSAAAVDQREWSDAGEDELLERARREDAWHRQTYQRPISAETLRKRLHVGAGRSRMLVTMLRSADADRRPIRASPAEPAPSTVPAFHHLRDASREETMGT